MSRANDGSILRDFQRLYGIGVVRDLSDGQVLERLASEEGERARQLLEVLVERHGGLVYAACRGVLEDPNDAWDAFQATFLILIRKARGLWTRGSLAPWLYEVARRTALHARSAGARRRRLERASAQVRLAEPAEERDEAHALVHEELARLPARYRDVIILCDLEDCLQDDAAARLGVPPGTVKSRLARGRARLRAALVKRGLGERKGGESALPVLLAKGAVPRALVQLTLEVSIRETAFKTLAASGAGALARGVLMAMAISRMLTIAGFAVAGAGAAGTAWSFAAAQVEKPRQVQATPAEKPPIVTHVPPSAVVSAVDMQENILVAPGPMRLSYQGTGRLEPDRTVDLVCAMPEQSVITKLLPQGARVKKGDVVAEFELSPEQQAAFSEMRQAALRARSDHEAALARLKAAELAVAECEQGVGLTELAEAKSRSNAARLALAMDEGRLKRLVEAQGRLLRTKKESPAPAAAILGEIEIDDRVDQARRAVKHDQAQIELGELAIANLEQYTIPRRKAELLAVLAKQRGETAALEELRTRAERDEARAGAPGALPLNSVIRAPSDGVVVSRRRHGSNDFYVQGGFINPGETVASIADVKTCAWVVRVSMPATQVIDLRPGQRVTARVVGRSALQLAGTVLEVGDLPERSPFVESAALFPVVIRIDRLAEHLRMGLPVAFDIEIGKIENVISVPTSALATQGPLPGFELVQVITPAGVENRGVQIGKRGPGVVQITGGLQRGETVRRVYREVLP